MDDATIAKAVETLEGKVSDMDAFGATVRFDFDGEGAILVDGNSAPPSVKSDADSDADCTITASQDIFQEMLEGDLDPTAAYMTGKIKIDGDMSAAMTMARVLG